MWLLGCRAGQAVTGMGGGMVQNSTGGSINNSSWGLSWENSPGDRVL